MIVDRLTAARGGARRRINGILISFPALIVLMLSAAAAPAVGGDDGRLIGYITGEGEGELRKASEEPIFKPSTQRRTLATDINFVVSYLDDGTGLGFDDPALGAARKATVDAVLTYLDSLFDANGACEILFPQSADLGGALARGGPRFFDTGPFEPPFALAHIMTGFDPWAGGPDIEVTVDFSFNWHLGTTPNPGNKDDFYSVLLHEISHGLGIISFTRSSGLSMFDPTVLFSTWDERLFTGAGSKIWGPTGNFNGSPSWLTGSESGVEFRGPNAMAANGGQGVPIYAPNPYNGSSIGHIDDNQTPSAVMEPRITVGQMVRTYRDFEIGILEDLGYAIAAGAPVADFSATPTSGFAPLQVSFTDSSTNGPTSWAWDFDNNGSTDSTEQNPTHAYNAVGAFTVKLTATNANGSGIEIKTAYIDAQAPPPPVASFYATRISGFDPLWVTFIDTTSNNPIQWAWDFDNDGSTDSTEQNPTWSYDDPGVYTVKLTATNLAASANTDDEVRTDFITVLDGITAARHWQLLE